MWLEAANLIAKIEEKCLGRNVKKLRRELGEETWITELREADRKAHLTQSTSQTVQWAHW
jgi:hypothetical protein